jgi:transcriptional regulator with GAF, ATPase, and Fis domain
LPPLRERKNDISLLVHYFVNKYANKMSKQINNISQTTMDKLQNYPWPGNVRELENIIERAVILSPKKSLHIPELQVSSNNNISGSDKLLPLIDMEKSHIIKVLKITDWKISGEQGAAAILEMHPNTLRSRMNKLGIRRSNTTL